MSRISSSLVCRSARAPASRSSSAAALAAPSLAPPWLWPGDATDFNAGAVFDEHARGVVPTRRACQKKRRKRDDRRAWKSRDAHGAARAAAAAAALASASLSAGVGGTLTKKTATCIAVLSEPSMMLPAREKEIEAPFFLFPLWVSFGVGLGSRSLRRPTAAVWLLVGAFAWRAEAIDGDRGAASPTVRDARAAAPLTAELAHLPPARKDDRVEEAENKGLRTEGTTHIL